MYTQTVDCPLTMQSREAMQSVLPKALECCCTAFSTHCPPVKDEHSQEAAWILEVS